MIRARLQTWLDRLVLWLRERLVAPAVRDVIIATSKEIAPAFAETRRDGDARYRLLIGAITDARLAMRAGTDDLAARLDQHADVVHAHRVSVLRELVTLARQMEEMRAATEEALQTHARTMAAGLATAREEERAMHEQGMVTTTARLDRVDERIAALAARMYGKHVAETVIASRGPRAFTHEDRQ